MAAEPFLELLMLKGDSTIACPRTHQRMVADEHLQHGQRFRLTRDLPLLPQLRDRRRDDPAGVGLRHRRRAAGIHMGRQSGQDLAVATKQRRLKRFSVVTCSLMLLNEQAEHFLLGGRASPLRAA